MIKTGDIIAFVRQTRQQGKQLTGKVTAICPKHDPKQNMECSACPCVLCGKKFISVYEFDKELGVPNLWEDDKDEMPACEHWPPCDNKGNVL
jgi:hypothetical protein